MLNELYKLIQNLLSFYYKNLILIIMFPTFLHFFFLGEWKSEVSEAGISPGVINQSLRRTTE